MENESKNEKNGKNGNLLKIMVYVLSASGVIGGGSGYLGNMAHEDAKDRQLDDYKDKIGILETKYSKTQKELSEVKSQLSQANVKITEALAENEILFNEKADKDDLERVEGNLGKLTDKFVDLRVAVGK